MNLSKIRYSLFLALVAFCAIAFGGCRHCGALQESEYVCNHPHVATNITVSASCTEDGLLTYSCLNCNSVLEETVINATGHTYDAFIVIREPFMGQNGVEEGTCTTCGKTETREFACAHSATYTHTVGGFSCTNNTEVNTICQRCGLVLNTTVTEATGHSYGEWQILIEATPLENGIRYRTCQKCAYTHSEVYSFDTTSDHCLYIPHTRINDIVSAGVFLRQM